MKKMMMAVAMLLMVAACGNKHTHKSDSDDAETDDQEMAYDDEEDADEEYFDDENAPDSGTLTFPMQSFYQQIAERDDMDGEPFTRYAFFELCGETALLLSDDYGTSEALFHAIAGDDYKLIACHMAPGHISFYSEGVTVETGCGQGCVQTEYVVYDSHTNDFKRLLSYYCTLDENGTATDEGVTIFSTGEELLGHREASDKLDFAMAAMGDEVDLDLDWQPLEE